MKISERGQVTIPKELREKFGLRPNTEVRFVEQETGLLLEHRPGSRKAAVDRIYGRRDFGRSTDELMTLIRE